MKQYKWPQNLLRRLRFMPPSALPTGCIEYTGHPSAKYPQVKTPTGLRLAHRSAYELVRERIEPGFDLDHLCRNPRCCNPGHLEPVSHAENCRRGTAGEVNGGRERAKTHCPQGHPYEGDNLFIDRKGGRRCMECQREAGRRAYAKRKAST